MLMMRTVFVIATMTGWEEPSTENAKACVLVVVEREPVLGGWREPKNPKDGGR